MFQVQHGVIDLATGRLITCLNAMWYNIFLVTINNFKVMVDQKG